MLRGNVLLKCSSRLHSAARRTENAQTLGGLIQAATPLTDPAIPIEKIRQAAIDVHRPLVEEAGRRGVQILGLQEIFNGPYFCPSQDPDWYDIAEPVPGPDDGTPGAAREEARHGDHRATREPLAAFNSTSPEMAALISETELREGFAILDRALTVTDKSLATLP